MPTFNLRPHHLLCCLCFQRNGYDEEFVKNFKQIHKQLNSTNSKHTTIKLVNDCDDICTKCPKNTHGFCNTEEKVRQIDQAYLAALQLKIGDTLTFNTVKIKIRELLTIDDFHQACAQCSWHSLNICAPIIVKLLKK